MSLFTLVFHCMISAGPTQYISYAYYTVQPCAESAIKLQPTYLLQLSAVSSSQTTLPPLLHVQNAAARHMFCFSTLHPELHWKIHYKFYLLMHVIHMAMSWQRCSETSETLVSCSCSSLLLSPGSVVFTGESCELNRHTGPVFVVLQLQLRAEESEINAA